MKYATHIQPPATGLTGKQTQAQTGLRSLHVYMKAACLFVVLGAMSLTKSYAAFVGVISTPTTVAPANACQGNTNILIYQFSVNNSGSSLGALSGFSFTQGGSAGSSDIITYKLWSGSVGGTLVATVTATSTTLTGTSAIASGATVNYFVTADIATGATPGHTITVSPIAATNVIFLSGTKSLSGTAATGGLQTIIAGATFTGVSSLCAGSTITLTPSATGGVWATGTTSVATVAGGIVGGVVAGTSSISYTLSGCTYTQVETVSNVTTPSVTMVQSPAGAVCAGTNTRFTPNVTNGGAPSYQWYVNSALVSTVTNYQTNTYNNGDLVYVVVTSSLPCSSPTTATSATATVTVNPTPAITAGPTTVCVGGTITLNATPSGGTWSSSNTRATVGLSSGIVTGVSSTGTSPNITYTLAGCTDNQTITVSNSSTPHANINAISGTTVCSGATANFSASSTGTTGATYRWIVNSTLANTGTTFSSSTLANGDVVKVVVTTTAACATTPTDTATVTMIVNPSPSLTTSFTTGCTGLPDTFIAAPTGGVWASGNTTVATIGTTGIMLGIAAGTSTISYTVAGCSATSNITVGLTPPAFTITPSSAAVCAGSVLSVSAPAITATNVTPPAFPSTGAFTVPDNIPAGITNAIAVSGIPGDATIADVSVVLNSITMPFDRDLEINIGAPNGVILNLVNRRGANFGAVADFTNTVISSLGGSAFSGGTAPFTGTFAADVASGRGPSGFQPTANTWPPLFTIPNGNWTLGIHDNGSGDVATVNNWSVIIHYTTPAGSYTWSSTTALYTTSGLSTLYTGGPANAVYASPATAATYTAIKTETGSACSSTSNVTVSVNAAPSIVATATPNPVCVGTTVTLNATASGGGGTFPTYSWAGPGTFTATTASTTDAGITAAGTNVYSVSVTDNNGCTGSTSVSVTVGAAPSITATLTPTPICAGRTLTLNATPAGGSGTYPVYSWSGPNGFTATTKIATNPAMTLLGAGVYSVTVTDGNGCTSPIAVTTAVSVNPMPTITATVTPTVLCAGGTLNLSATPAGGSGTYTLYSWTGPSGFTSSIRNTSAASVTASGVYSVSVTDDNGCRSLRATTAFVTVNPLPVITATATPTAVCAGSTLSLSATATGGSTVYNTFTWSGPVSVTSTSQNASVTGITSAGAGTYSVTVTDNNGCTSATGTTAAVSVNALPVVTASVTPNPLCAGATLSLNASATGGSGSYPTFNWSGPGSFSTTGQSATRPGVTVGGIYSVTVTDNNGCTSPVVSSATVTVNPLPVITATATPTAICAGSTLSLNATPSGGSTVYSSYSWSGPNLFTATTQNATNAGITSAGAGTYSVTVTDNNGCTSAIGSTLPVTVSPLPNVTDFSMPSATSGCIGVSSTVTVNSSSLGAGTFNVIYDLTGANTVTAHTASLVIASGTGSFTIPSTDLTGSGATTVTVTAVAGGGGCNSTLSAGNTANFAINPMPASITGVSSVCLLGTTTLNDASTGGNWTSANTALASVGLTSGIVTGAAVGSTTVTYTLPTGCATAIPVLVNPIPNIYTVTGGGNYCSNNPNAHVGLSGSDLGASYQLYLNVSAGPAPIGGLVTGTGGLLDFGVELSNGVYSVIANPSATCAVGMTGTVEITEFVSPVAFAVIGGGAYCNGGTGVTIGLANSQSGVSYQLFNGGASGSPITGSGPAISFGLRTAAGTYTVVATNTISSCTSSMTGSATVTINPVPPSITGNPQVCTGLTTTLSDALTGGTWSSSSLLATVDPSTGVVTGFLASTPTITYTVANCTAIKQITVNTSPASITGSLVGCAGSTLSLNDATTGGAWSSSSTGVATVNGGSVTAVTAGNTNISYSLPTGCSSTVTVTINSQPSPIGGATILCAGLPSSLTNVITGGTWSSSNTFIASVNPSTGSVLGSGLGTANITYTLPGGCSSNTPVLVNPSGLISGPGAVCPGSTITLTNTTTGGAWTSGSTATATVGGSSGIVSGVAAGVVTITYTTLTGCTSPVFTVTVNSLPALKTVTGGGSYCLGGAGTHIGLGSSDAGVTYQLFNGATAVSAALAGTGSGLDFGLVTAAGTFTVVATNTTTGCTRTMTGSAAISINPLPSAFIVSGGGSYCSGTTGVHVMLSSSTAGVGYQLYDGSVPMGISVIGTGLSIDFGTQTAGGSYGVVATNPVTSCFSVMSGSAFVNVLPLPAAYAVTGGGSYCAGDAGVHVFLTSSAIGTDYQLFNGVVPVGAPVHGTSAAIDFGSLTAAGTYTVSGTNLASGCTGPMSGSALITINPLPTANTVTGGGGYCFGTASTLPVGLNGSIVGNSYQLLFTGAPLGSPQLGTGTSLNFGVQSNAGTYTVRATTIATGCNAIMGGNAVIAINSLPAVFAVTGGGNYCPGTSSVHVGLAGSAIGVNYQLYSASSPTGSAVPGTGVALDFGAFAAGSYNVVATSGVGCTNSMSGSASIILNAVPASFTVSGGGSYCSGSTAPHVLLGGSVFGTTYQLLNGATIASSLAGTGASLDFGAQTIAGTYTVKATNATTGCTATMTSSATITINSLPTATFTVTGGGSYCAGGTGKIVGLSGSQSGISYQLFANGIASGSPITGSGPAVNFPLQTTVGSYTVVGTSGSSCSSNMTGSVSITTTPVPVVYNVTGGGGYCSGTTTGVHIGLASSNSGINYQLFLGTTAAVGAPVAGVGAALDFGAQTAVGTYTIIATNTTTSCTNSMFGNAVVSTSLPPAVYTLSGGGSYCAGGAGLPLSINNSDAGVSYQLLRGGVPAGSPLGGTGTTLSFGNQAIAGSYAVVATNVTTTCTSNMAGVATIATTPLPAVFAVSSDAATYCAGGAGVHVRLGGSATGFSYQLYNAAATVGSPVAGTGAALDFGAQTTGVYTIVATNNTTSCTNQMAGTIVITTTPLPAAFNITGSGNYCAGGAGLNIGLSGSATGISYQLSNGSSVGTPITGTGAAINFGMQTAGTYTVIASNITTGCTQTMTGAATIGINALPVAQTLNGGGNYCAGGTGVDVSLAASNTGITYQLYNGTAPVGALMPGTGAAIDFGLETIAGHYAVVATTTATGCTNRMADTVTVGISPLPNVYSVTGGGNYCPSGTGVVTGLSGSDMGVNYQLYNGVVATGTPVAGTGSAITFGSQVGVGNYTVIAVSATTPCTSNMSGSATVGLNTLPIAYNVTGGGDYCAGGTGLHIGLDQTDAGTAYQLYNGITPVGAAFAGTGFAIDFGLQTALGTYTVMAANTATTCTSVMAGSTPIAIDALPAVHPITGGGNYCVGTGGMHISLLASDGGISYQLYNGTLAVGSPIMGTGSSIDFGAQTTPGTYTIAGTNTTTTCSSNMSGSTTISINTPPTAFSVTGGGNYCAGSVPAVHVGLNGSTAGISYQLYNGAPVGTAFAGTGSSIDFGVQSATGTYTIIATNTTTSCTTAMSGSANVGVNVVPAAFTVGSSASQYCAGGTGVSLSLSNSQAGVNYQLYANTVPSGIAVAGTGLGLSFGLQTSSGTYAVIATNATTGCVSNMAGSAVITISALPTVYAVVGGGNYCSGADGVHVGLSSSHVGTLYQLYNGVTPVGSVSAGTGFALDFGAQTIAGTYSIVANNPATSCVSTMGGVATVGVNSLPVPFTVTGGGNYCAAGTGVNVGLSGSTAGVSYQLSNGTTGIGAPVAGTGSSIGFGTQTGAGSYTVVATNTATGCVNNMTGSAPVATIALPSAYSLTGGGNYCLGGTGLHVGMLNSDAGTSYQLFNGTGAASAAIPGTGVAVDFGTYTTAGSYTVVATNTTTGCTAAMPGAAVIVINTPPAAYTVTGGGNYCAGGLGVHVSLSNSTAGTTYQLLNGTLAAGAPAPGTGITVDFGLQSAPGTYSVVAVNPVTGCTATMAGSASVTVSPVVAPAVSISTGDDTVCAGTTITINSVTSNAGTTPAYTWTVNGLPLAETSGALTYAPAVGDVVGLTVMSSAACATPSSASAMIPVNVLSHGMPAMTITSSLGDVVCQGAAVTFTAVTSYGGSAPSYTWLVNGASHGTGTTLTYTPANGDVVYGILNSNYQCRLATSVTSNHANMEVDVPATPVVSIAANPGTSVKPGQVVLLTSFIANTINTPTYQWLLNGQPIAGATSSSYVVTVFSDADSFTCVVTSGGGCGGLQGAKSVVMHTSEGVQQVATTGSDVKLVPNPNKGIFTVKGSLGTTSDEQVTVEVTDMLGQVIYKENVMAHGGMIDQKVQLSNTLANGMYILNLRSSSANDVFHVVIEQ